MVSAMYEFLESESGAIAADWVVLTSGLVGVGLTAGLTLDPVIQASIEEISGQISNAEACLLPHPRMQDRDFVLKPMAEVAPPDWRHPMSRKTISQLLEALA